jgi:hypothetical protein
MFLMVFVAISRRFLKNNIVIILGGHDGSMAEMIFRRFQMLWPTTSGIYPWEAQASEEFRNMQPVLSKIPSRVS